MRFPYFQLEPGAFASIITLIVKRLDNRVKKSYIIHNGCVLEKILLLCLYTRPAQPFGPAGFNFGLYNA